MCLETVFTSIQHPLVDDRSNSTVPQSTKLPLSSRKFEKCVILNSKLAINSSFRYKMAKNRCISLIVSPIMYRKLMGKSKFSNLTATRDQKFRARNSTHRKFSFSICQFLFFPIQFFLLFITEKYCIVFEKAVVFLLKKKNTTHPIRSSLMFPIHQRRSFFCYILLFFVL